MDEAGAKGIEDADWGRVIGSFFAGDGGVDEENVKSGRLKERRLKATRRAKSTRRDWRPSFRTLVTVSLMLVLLEAFFVGEEEEDAGECVLSAERM